VTKLRKIQVILLSIFIIALFWIVLFIVSFTSNNQTNKLAPYVPESATAVATIHNQKIINRVIYDILFSGNETVQALEKYNLDEQDFESGVSGINMLENMVVFQSEFDQENITGFLFVLTDRDAFSGFHLIKANEAKYFNDEVGCILLANQQLDEEKRKKLEGFAAKIITSKQSGSLANTQSSPKEEEVLSFDFKGDSADYFLDFNMEVLLKDSSISFNGMGTKNPIVKYNRFTRYEFRSPKTDPFIEINLGETTDSIQHYLADLLNDYQVELPLITAQQVIFYGFYIDDVNESTAFLPQFDGIFHFDDTVDFSLVIAHLAVNDERVKRIDSTGFKIGSVVYNIRQLTPDEVAIFTSKNPVIQRVTAPPFPSLTGNPSAVLNFDGTGFIAQMARMIPPVKNARIFLEDLSLFEFRMSQEENDLVQFKGEIRFKEGKKPTLEILQLLMKF
jgi:hypothetical protein